MQAPFYNGDFRIWGSQCITFSYHSNSITFHIEGGCSGCSPEQCNYSISYCSWHNYYSRIKLRIIIAWYFNQRETQSYWQLTARKRSSLWMPQLGVVKKRSRSRALCTHTVKQSLLQNADNSHLLWDLPSEVVSSPFCWRKHLEVRFGHQGKKPLPPDDVFRHKVTVVFHNFNTGSIWHLIVTKLSLTYTYVVDMFFSVGVAIHTYCHTNCRWWLWFFHCVCISRS